MAREYVCGFSCSLFGGGLLYSAYPEGCYSRAVALIRSELTDRGLTLEDGAGRPLVFQPPVDAAEGEGCFPEVRFDGYIYGAAKPVVPFSAVVHVPTRLGRPSGWGCRVVCMPFGIAVTIAAGWPERAYEQAFEFLRNTLAGDDERLIGRDGAALVLVPPVE